MRAGALGLDNGLDNGPDSSSDISMFERAEVIRACLSFALIPTYINRSFKRLIVWPSYLASLIPFEYLAGQPRRLQDPVTEVPWWMEGSRFR